MKKMYILFFIIGIIMFTLPGCRSNQNKSSANISYFHVDWPYYNTADDLLEKASDVFEGKIVNIFFKTIDTVTGKVTDSVNEDTDIWLYTVYEIETTQVYKGDNSGKKYISIIGGMPNFKENEQIQIMEKCGILDDNHSIPVLTNRKTLDIGSSYLFVACDLGGEYLYAANIDQFAFEIDKSGTVDKTASPNFANIKDVLLKPKA